MEDLSSQLAQIQVTLNKILEDLNIILTAMNAPGIALSVHRISSTKPGPAGQVIPGDMVLSGIQASDFYRTLKEPSVLPLQDLPPWTHMALADGSWWLLAMGAPQPDDI